MKYLYFSLIALFIVMNASGQSNLYYYADGERQSLEIDRNTLVVHFAPSEVKKFESFQSEGLFEKEIHDAYGRALLRFEQPVNEANFTARDFGIAERDLFSVKHSVRLDDGFELALTHEVVVQFADSKIPTQAGFQNLLSRYGATYLRNDYGTDIYLVSDPFQGLELANQLEERGISEWSHPDFYAKVTRYNDPFFSQQFQMKNTGQVVNGWTGVAGIDCGAEAAWAISLGSASITVAVVDDGLEAHEDLVTSGGVSRVLAGNTPATGGNGTPRFNSDAHGMACAGILGATHNNSLGIRGVAPLVGLRSVNIFWGGETSQTISNGINWARTQGVDVISNSWGYTSCSLSFNNLNNALTSARNNGRNGKGCVIVFASGNGGQTCIDYPANRDAVMAVGSVTNRGEHSTYSNRGSQLSLVAPSDPSPSQPGASVRTIDRMGSAGYVSGNYYAFFGGTSAACPVVAGAAALVLAYNPDLTEADVRNLLQSTATDMGPAGFDNTFGHGRVNVGAAIAALEESACQDEVLNLNLVLDNYPGETTWQITADGGGVVASSNGNYSGNSPGSVINQSLCLPSGCYTFTIFDSFGDGICCGFGNGSYSLTNSDGIVLASGGQFATSESTPFCTGETGPVCADPFPEVSNLSFVVQPNGVLLSWDPVPGSTFCIINGSLLNGNGEKSITQNGSELGLFFIPKNQFPLNANYRVRVRCGCQQNPEIVGPWTPYVTFFFSGATNLVASGSLHGEGQLLGMSVYPNPSRGEVRLSVEAESTHTAMIRLFDLVGKQAFQQNVTIQEGMQQIQLDLGALPAAMYLLQLDGGAQGNLSTRLVLER